MTAIKGKAQDAVPLRRPRLQFVENFIRCLIIACTALALVLSSIAVCDGHWLLSQGQMYSLWHMCTTGPEAPSAANCTTHFHQSGVRSMDVWLGLCRVVVSLAVVSAIFGLELLLMAQVSRGRDSSRRWRLGSLLVLVAAGFSAGGVVDFVVLLWSHATPLGFTLTFWCQFAAAFLFLITGLAAHHVQQLVERENPELREQAKW